MVWGKGFWDLLRRHVETNLLCYLLILAIFVIGLTVGSISVNALDEDLRKDLLSYISVFIRDLLIYDNPVTPSRVLYAALSNNLRTVITIWLLGVSVVGVPFILLIVMVRGFVLGFTVAFLVNEMGVGGFAFSIMSVLPHNLIAIPAILISAATGVSFSYMVIKSKRNARKIDYLGELINYSKWAVLCTAVLVGASIVETYLTPVFMKAVSSYLS